MKMLCVRSFYNMSHHVDSPLSKIVLMSSIPIPSIKNVCLETIVKELKSQVICWITIWFFHPVNYPILYLSSRGLPFSQVLCRWILSVKKNYRPVKYHNWRHALNVAQTMFAMLKTGKMERFMSELEILGLLVACLCHDLDHRGTNNAFQTKTESPLAILYTTSTMEHHHFDQCVMILNSETNNIFQVSQ